MTRSAQPVGHSFAAMAIAVVLLFCGRTAGAESTLTINSFPVAEVLIDGKSVGNTPLLKVKVKPGRHRVQFVRNNSPRVTRTITVRKGQHQRLIVKLDKPPAAHSKASGRLHGTLQITSIPWAKVFLDGKQIGITPLRARVKAGNHMLRLTNPKHGSITRHVKITPGKSTRLAVSLGTKKLAAMTTPAKPVATADGLLEVRAKPSAIVFVAGKRIGTTPIRRHALAAGQHRIILVQQDIATTHDVMIRRGKTTRLNLATP